jgi:hypothetical protein
MPPSLIPIPGRTQTGPGPTIMVPAGGDAPPGADPWAQFMAPPQDATAAPAAPSDDQGAPANDPWAQFMTPPKEDDTANQPPQKIGAGEAATLGGVDALSFGLTPAIAGLTAAGKDVNPLPHSPDDVSEESQLSDMGSALAKMFGPKTLGDLVTGGNPVQAKYDATRKAALDTQNNAYAQHPLPFIGGQLGGALLSAPVGGGETLLARLLKMAGTGAVTTGGYNAGSSVSAGDSPGQVLKNAVQGFGSGAIIGGVGGAAVEGLGAIGSKLLSVFRGGVKKSDQAAANIVQALDADDARAGHSFDPEALAAAHAAGIPLSIADAGGERTMALARSAANTSPEGRAALSEFAHGRFEGQSGRAAGFIRRITGNPDNYLESEAVRAEGRRANGPAYTRSYNAGDRPIWNPELERLSGSPDVIRAARSAQHDWKAWQIADGFGAMNPGVRIEPGGRLQFTNGHGVPTYPNIQFWDYTARHLADEAQKARDAGKRTLALRLGTQERALKATLDAEVPEYQAARRGAAGFFGSEDALDAGERFVSGSFDKSEARAAIDRMTRPDRELFARGFAAKLANEIERTGYNRDILNNVFLNNDDARQRIRMALGSDRARQLEAYLRAEGLADRLRKALGNSTTARQLKEMGMAGSAAGALEASKELGPIPAMVAGGIALLLKSGADKIDEGVARRVGELLVSNDPRNIVKGVGIIARTPTLFNALRRVTASGAVVTAHNVGARKAAAAVASIYGDIAGSGDHETDRSVMDLNQPNQ